ncbi:hypothetical protein [Chakrabartyella piscis]|uniref:hypothetical protein n=1 Tax=Chakrabartyella piscis TaxID=2918914 RepID=UPI0029587C6B|nr:hypothetical protein [Chakrabartyella piscis]
MDKIELINSYIEKCNHVKREDAKRLASIIYSVFATDIKGLSRGIHQGKVYVIGDVDRYDYLDDIVILKEKLSKYAIDLEDVNREKEYEIEKLRLQAEVLKSSVTVNNTNNNQSQSQSVSESTANVTISIKQVINRIENLSPNILSDEEKSELEDKMSAIEIAKNSKDKKKLMDKLGSVLEYITNKGVEVGIAVLPYLGDISKFIEIMQ